MDKELQTILLRARDDVYGILNGGNISRVLGEGYDFAELREYNIGDDIRHISWINSAKLGEPYIKKMHEERELNIAVCSLVDGRFIVGEKRNTLSYILAILGYSSYAQNNSFLPISILGNSIKIGEKSKNIESIDRYIERIYNFNSLGTKINYNKVQSTLLNSLENKTLLFIVGDFLDTIDLSILAQKHDIVVVIVRDKLEETPLISSNSQLINPQTNYSIDRMLSKKAIDYYRAKLIEHDNRLIKKFTLHNIRYTKIYNIDEVLSKLKYI